MIRRTIRGLRSGGIPPGYFIGSRRVGRGIRAPELIPAADTIALAAGGNPVQGGAGAGAPLPAVGSTGQVIAVVAGAWAATFTTLITGLGTIATGVWQGTKIALGYGGTGADLSATGPGFLKQASSGATITVRTATQTTSDLDAMVGDSGAGGTKGLVPAPAAGSAAAGKFLKADGTFAVPAGTSTGTVTNTGTLTNHAPIIGTGGVDIKALAAMTNGQLIIGSTGADPVLATLTAGSGVTITPAAGAITIAASSTGGGGSGFAPLELALVAHANVTISGASKPILHASGWSPPGTASLTGYYLSCSHTTTSENTWLIFWDTTNSHGYLLDLQGDNNLVWYSVTAAGNVALASATSGGGGRVLTTTPVGVSLIAGIVGINAATDNSFSGRHHWTEVIFPFRSTTYNFLTGTWELYVSPDSNTTVHHLYQVDLKTNPFMG